MVRIDWSRWRLVSLAVVVTCGGLWGCEREQTASYDPKVDGIIPQQTASVDPSILDDQKLAHPAMTPPRPAPVTPARPDAIGGGTPPPPAEVTPPPPPPPGEEGAAPATAPAVTPAVETVPATPPAEAVPATPG